MEAFELDKYEVVEYGHLRVSYWSHDIHKEEIILQPDIERFWLLYKETQQGLPSIEGGELKEPEYHLTYDEFINNIDADDVSELLEWL